jgi:hypothetical protein
VLPEDDLRIETCRSVLNVLVLKILDYYNITVHSLVCNKLNIPKMHGATIKVNETLVYRKIRFSIDPIMLNRIVFYVVI